MTMHTTRRPTTVIRRRINGPLLLASLLLASCGGGGGGGDGSAGTPPPTTAPPYDLKYPSSLAFTINTAITPVTPTVVGEVTSYSVSPGLPAGLSLDTTTGVISGTPTSVTAQANYTFKATNAVGWTTVAVSIVVNVAPSIAYSSYYSFTANIAAQTIKPMGGVVSASWAISPALPAGLVFDTTTGSINGTPTVTVAPSTYTVIATNSSGQSKATMTLAVVAAPLLDVGHSTAVELIRYTNSSLISLDSDGHWVLQAYGSGAILASGDGACSNCSPENGFVYPPVDVAGTTAIDVAARGIEVRSAVSGQLLATIPGTFSWFQLASDGSYIATGSTKALTAWSTAGNTLLTLAGNYSNAIAFSAPGQIQVALGPVGQSVIQTLFVPSGSSTVSPAFQGAFTTWFVDGNGFLTRYGDNIWAYSSAAVQQNIITVTGQGAEGGEGPFFWNDVGGSLDIYQLGGSASPVFTTTANTIVPSGMTLATFQSNQLVVIDLSGATPVSTSYTLPAIYPSTYAATSASSWVVGNDYGVIFDGASLAGQPRYLTLGQATSIAGGTAYFSIATASGEILYFDATTDAMLGTVNFQGAPGSVPTQLSTSSDGTVLAVVVGCSTHVYQYPCPPVDVNVYSLPSGTLIDTFPNVDTSPNYSPSFELSLSGTASVLAMTPTSISACGTVVSGISIWCGGANTVQVSPDGTLVAASTTPALSGTLTSIVPIAAPTMPVATVSGWVVGWLDNSRLLAEQFAEAPPPPNLPGGQPTLVYQGADIYSSSGTNLGSAATPFPQIQSLQAVTSDSIYSPQTNTIVSLTTGMPIWISGDAFCSPFEMDCNPAIPPPVTSGAITGSQVIFALGPLVLAQPY
jgi:hypothetical protein